MNLNNEFGKDFNFKDDFKSFNNKIITYLKEKNINWNNSKIYLVIGGIILGSLILPNPPSIENDMPLFISENIIAKLNNAEFIKNINDNELLEVITNEEVNNEDIKIENKINNPKPKNDTIIETKPNKKNEPNKTIIELHRNNKVINLELEDYLIGVVGAEMPASFHIEALKAQSIVARTYVLKKIKENKIITDTIMDQVYKDNEELKLMWGLEFDKYFSKIKEAVTKTASEYLSYNNNFIEAVYHSTSNGKTEDASYVWGNSFPYLISVESPWDLNATSYYKETTKDFDNFSKLTGINLNEFTTIEILSKTNSGRVEKIKINNTVWTGIELRTLLGLRSTDFELIINNNEILIKTKGYGHGVGMSQYGADGMAKAGYNYKEILNHYYPNTILKK